MSVLSDSSEARAIQRLIDESPFHRMLDLKCIGCDVEAGTVQLRMPAAAHLMRSDAGRQFHGGSIASLVDVAGDMAVALRQLAAVPTINFRVDYLKPSSGQFLEASARVRRLGRTVAVVDVDIHDDQGRLTAVGRGCFGASPG
ncbi:MAG: PaaI family thioesterase [Hyphomonadaceae bacterium]|jgi:uncharacterized protein (TIGR00369 family)|nr:PaaI family thioesterase [Hyphomonadaceae bacterium]